ncbi:hypothetical protein SZ58_004640 [Mycobacterium tuberculosis variant bovis]|nr:hypothetical protein SZ58_004640 [Mycobacterium tuberculosis variant bovis]
MAGPTAPTTAPTAIRAGGPLLSPVRRNIIFTALVFGALVAATGQTIVVPALPTIVAELGSTVDQSWAVTSYLLGGTVVVVVAGKLGDLLGRNRVLLGSVVVFVVGSVLCGLSQTMTMLAISRALQGVGAGAISVTAYALAAEVVPLRDRGRYQGVLGAVFGVNTVTGPLLGGWLTDYLSWRWAFWINVPVSIAVLTVAATAVPALARPPKPVIDYLGILVIAVATTALIMATSWGGTTYAWGSATIVGLLIGAAVALGFFVWLEGRARCGHPAAQAVWQPSICRVLRPVLRGRIRDAGCTDLRTDLSGVRGRRVGDRVRSAHVADGDRPADRLDRDGCPGRPDGPLQDLPGRGDGADGGCVPADVADGRVDATAAAIAVPGRPRCRHRIVHAGARSHRAEHVVFRRPRRRNIGCDLLPGGRRLVWYRNIRCVVRKLPGPKTRFRADVGRRACPGSAISGCLASAAPEHGRPDRAGICRVAHPGVPLRGLGHGGRFHPGAVAARGTAHRHPR